MQTKRKDKPHDMSEASVDDVTACMCVNVHASVFICVAPSCVCYSLYVFFLGMLNIILDQTSHLGHMRASLKTQVVVALVHINL